MSSNEIYRLKGDSGTPIAKRQNQIISISVYEGGKDWRGWVENLKYLFIIVVRPKHLRASDFV